MCGLQLVEIWKKPQGTIDMLAGQIIKLLEGSEYVGQLMNTKH